jgi:hypothetical protein
VALLRMRMIRLSMEDMTRRMKRVGYVARMRQLRNVRSLFGKNERKEPVARLRHRWEYHIKMKMWTKFIRFRLGSNGGLLLIW